MMMFDRAGQSGVTEAFTSGEVDVENAGDLPTEAVDTNAVRAAMSAARAERPDEFDAETTLGDTTRPMAAVSTPAASTAHARRVDERTRPLPPEVVRQALAPTPEDSLGGAGPTSSGPAPIPARATSQRPRSAGRRRRMKLLFGIVFLLVAVTLVVVAQTTTKKSDSILIHPTNP
jgi:hypothetical protein